MFKHSWVVVYGIFCASEAVIKISKHSGKDKSVNLALETVFEFENQDKKDDVNILNEVQRFIGKVKHVIENNNGGRRHLLGSSNKIFTGFLIDMIQIINLFKDQELEHFVYLFSQEMKNHHYDGCKFHELAGDIEQEKTLANMLTDIRRMPAEEIRNDLNNIYNKLKEEKYTWSERELLNTINSVYKEDSIGKFEQFLSDLEEYRLHMNTDILLSDSINKALRTILFDHYTNLTLNLRAAIMTKLADCLKKTDNDLEETETPQFLDNNPTSEAAQALRTRRQIYVEEDLDLQYVKNAREDWIAKSKSKDKKRKHTTKSHTLSSRKPKSEFNKDEIEPSRKLVKLAKRNRFVKAIPSVYSKSPDREKSDDTTNDFSTTRQVYVERNLDLKYNPEAYEYLKNNKKFKTNKVSSVRPEKLDTSRKQIKRMSKDTSKHTATKKKHAKKHKVEDNSKELKKKAKHRKDNEIETILTDFVIDFVSEEHKSAKINKKPLLKVTRLYGDDEDFDDKKPKYRSETKKLSFKTLYPTFLIDWSTPQPRMVKTRYEVPTRKTKEQLSKQDSIEDGQTFTHEPIRQGMIKLVKNLDYSIEVKNPNNIELKLQRKANLQNARYNKQYHSEDISRIPVTPSHQTTRYPVHIRALGLKGSESLGEKISRDPPILARQYDSSHKADRKQYRRLYSRVQTPIFNEGLSIEQYSEGSHKLSNRRNNNPGTEDNFDSNKHVLRRIENLENELELVKIQIKNDTNLIRKLNNKSNDKVESTTYNNDKLRDTQKIDKSLNLQEDYNIEDATKLKGINTKTTLQKSEAHENKFVNKQSNRNQDTNYANVIISTKYDPYRYESKLKSNDIDNLLLKTTQVMKEEYNHETRNNIPSRNNDETTKPSFDIIKTETKHEFKDQLKALKSDKIDQGRKAFPELHIEEIRSVTDEDLKTNDAKNIINQRSDEAITNINRTERDYEVSNKYSSRVYQLRNDTIRNQTETGLDSNWVEVVYRGKKYKNRLQGNNTDMKQEHSAYKKLDDFTRSPDTIRSTLTSSYENLTKINASHETKHVFAIEKTATVLKSTTLEVQRAQFIGTKANGVTEKQNGGEAEEHTTTPFIRPVFVTLRL